MPVAKYRPKAAAQAILGGKTLFDDFGWEYFWGKNDQGNIGFFRKKEIGSYLPIHDFQNLFSAGGEVGGENQGDILQDAAIKLLESYRIIEIQRYIETDSETIEIRLTQKTAFSGQGEGHE
jgi:hypothetical protein